MPESKRDPRNDPRPGDVTMFHDPLMTAVYFVTRRDGRLVYYRQVCNGDDGEHDTFIEDWVLGSKDDEVLHVAE